MAQKGAQRPRTDSLDRELAITQNVSQAPLEPPDGIVFRPGDEVYWLRVLDARARDDWPPVDLTLAAELAMAQADVRRESLLVDQEGTLVGDKVNPRFLVVEALHRRVGSLMRLLRMGGYTAGNSYNEGQRRTKERDVERRAKTLETNKAEDSASGANIYRLLA